MNKLPHVNGRECIAALQKGGFYVSRQTGSHVTLRRDNPFMRVTVPNHTQDIKHPVRCERSCDKPGFPLMNLLIYYELFTFDELKWGCMAWFWRLGGGQEQRA